MGSACRNRPFPHTIAAMNKIPATSLILLSLLALSGCGPWDKTPALTGGGMDMFTPVKMRLHPLSRVLPEAGATGPVVEARLEFTDQFGDIGKGAAPVYFEVFKYEALMPNHRGDRFSVWNFDLSKPDANKQHWDAITRTYLFKLPLPPGSLKKQTRVVLAATLSLVGSERLTDEITIDLK
jgi:hypothetical protein